MLNKIKSLLYYNTVYKITLYEIVNLLILFKKQDFIKGGK